MFFTQIKVVPRNHVLIQGRDFFVRSDILNRHFEKISYDQFKKDISVNEKLYNSYDLPTRSTNCSAGYDFKIIMPFILKPGQTITIPTGVKVSMDTNEFLMIVIRSSWGIKHNIRLCNQVGIVDSDYYNNETNEGHILISLKNEGDIDIDLKENDRIVQGIFVPYLTTGDESKINQVRTGGSGSTNGGI